MTKYGNTEIIMDELIITGNTGEGTDRYADKDTQSGWIWPRITFK